jgi:hypothetical protein
VSDRGEATPTDGMSLSRAAWITVTAICAIASLLLLINGYDGYSAVLLVVGLAAALNLLP